MKLRWNWTRHACAVEYKTTGPAVPALALPGSAMHSFQDSSQKKSGE